MAIVVVSNAGGSIAVGATYVGGVAPTNLDSIAFTATSGTLNIDSVVNIAGFDFTNHVGIINFTQPITINSSSNVHFVNLGTGGYTLTGTPQITYSNTVSTSTLSLTSNGTAWTGVLNLANSTVSLITLVDDWNQNGLFTTINNLNCRFIGNTFSINGICNGDSLGNLRFGGNNTALIKLNGTINLGLLSVSRGALQYVGGICNITNQLQLASISSNFILDIAGLNIPLCTVSVSAGGSIQLNSIPTFGILLISSVFAPVLFTGGNGFIVSEFRIGINSTVRPIVFAAGVEYIVNGIMNVSNANFSSSISGVKALLTFGQNINQLRVVNITATDIDSSNGRRVNNFYGTVTNCDNWRVWNDNTLPQAPSTF